MNESQLGGILLVLGLVLGFILGNVADTVSIDATYVNMLLDKCSTNSGLKEINATEYSYTATCSNDAIFIIKRD